MEVDEVLAALELDRVHAVKEELLPRRLSKVLLVELGSHRAPDLGTLIRMEEEEKEVSDRGRTMKRDDASERGRGKETNLNGSDVAFLSEIHPVGFVELGSDEVVEIRDPIVLSYERSWKGDRETVSSHFPSRSRTLHNRQVERVRLTSQSQLCVSLDRTDGSPEHVGRGDVNLVEQKESPLSRCEELHHLGRRVRSFRGVGDH